MDVLAMRFKILRVANSVIGKSSLPNFFVASKLRAKSMRISAFNQLQSPFQRDGRSKEQVHVFRHNDEGVEVEGSLSSIAIHCLQKEFCIRLDDKESLALPRRKGYEISASRGKRASRFHGGPQRLEAGFSLA
jgi:hypothetical protein